ncbi:MAG: DNA topoisomerase I [Candidatus Thermoplasmatota archaeon]|jgi:DNA topoisomerase-1|nr:DNA topoisomerase I [Candidatus Thermoplasmatota archaeon]
MTLIICEKNIAAERISRILSGNNMKMTRKYNRPYYSFSKSGEDYDVIGLRGHIVSLDYPPKYNNWQAVDPKDLIQVETETVNREISIIKALKTLVKAHDNVIIATDFDREGELIGTEALDIINRDGLDVKRVRFSSLTKDEILTAFTQLGEIDRNLANAAYTRQHLDLVWGASLTRFISLASERLGYDFLSIGRVQTPTLALLVNLERQIEAFVPEKYVLIKAELKKNFSFLAKYKKGKFNDREEAERILRKIEGEEKANVIKAVGRKSTQRPPAPFNTTSFLKDATKLGLTASKAMSVAEDIYTRGFISYPRTDNTVYPKSLDLGSILELFGSREIYGEFAREILSRGKLHPTRGKKEATDHPPIHPTNCPKEGELSGDPKRIFNLVVRRFFATLGENCIVNNGTVDLDISKEIFVAKSLAIISSGWRKYYTFNGITEKKLPEMKAGDIVDIIKIFKEEKETKPPSRYSQGSLISEMDKLELGTKSTRHEIIKKLVDREFVISTPLGPTLSGKAVIEAMEKYSKPITLPDMTKQLEIDMNLIAEGKMDPNDVSRESRKMLTEIFKVLEENRTKIGDSIKKALQDQKILGVCPSCGNDLAIRESRRGKRFAACGGYPKCRNSYPLPQRGRILILGEKCPVCQAPKIKVITKGRKPWIICINMGCEHNKQ